MRAYEVNGNKIAEGLPVAQDDNGYYVPAGQDNGIFLSERAWPDVRDGRVDGLWVVDHNGVMLGKPMNDQQSYAGVIVLWHLTGEVEVRSTYHGAYIYKRVDLVGKGCGRESYLLVVLRPGSSVIVDRGKARRASLALRSNFQLDCHFVANPSAAVTAA